MLTSAHKGFTLVELLVVISIIAILSVIGITVFSSVQKSARTSKRISDMKAIQTALELYYNDPVNNNQYPKTTQLAGGWLTECENPWGTGNLSPEQVIPGLVPTYMQSFPHDPAMDKANHASCYLYRSDGNDYKLLDHGIAEFSADDYAKMPAFYDPIRPTWSWQISSPGGRGW